MIQEPWAMVSHSSFRLNKTFVSQLQFSPLLRFSTGPGQATVRKSSDGHVHPVLLPHRSILTESKLTLQTWFLKCSTIPDFPTSQRSNHLDLVLASTGLS